MVHVSKLTSCLEASLSKPVAFKTNRVDIKIGVPNYLFAPSAVSTGFMLSSAFFIVLMFEKAAL